MTRYIGLEEIVAEFKRSAHTEASRAIWDRIEAGELAVVLDPNMDPKKRGMTRAAGEIRIKSAMSLEDSLATIVHEGQHESDLSAGRISPPALANDNQRAFAEARAFRREAEYARANNLTGTFAYRFDVVIRDEPETALESIITSYGLNVGDDEFRSILGELQ